MSAKSSSAFGMTTSLLRRRIRARTASAYDDLDTSPLHLDGKLQNRAESILEQGWLMAGFKLASLRPPIDWSAHNRSFSFHLHAWEPCTLLLHAHSRFGDQRYLCACIDFAETWIDSFSQITAAAVLKLVRTNLDKQIETFAWYDMAVGQRVYRLAYIVECLLRDPKQRAPRISKFWRSLGLHLEVLEEESFFKKHSNHGLYQALGQLAAANRFTFLEHMSAWKNLAERRLAELIDLHFFRSGVHREHSPGYHSMLLNSLVGACHSGLISDKSLVERISGLEEALSWMIKPDLKLCTIGDTDPRLMALGREHAMRHKNSGLRWQISGGQCGSRPPTGVKCYQDAGYAFARLKPSSTRADDNEMDSYLGVAAGFHSRVHKHADHMSFVWFDGGRDILIDPARYGYEGRTEAGSELFEQGFWYSDPRRIYCESTRAHNTVEIDGKSFPRFRVRPFGSALEGADCFSNRAYITCSATHFRRIRHKRRLIMEPGRFLLVLDWLFDRTRAHHDYRQYFQFDHDWVVSINDGLLRAHHAGASPTTKPSPARRGEECLQSAHSPLTVRAATLIDKSAIEQPIRGQTLPYYQGWTSNAPHSIIPATSVHVHSRNNDQTCFATLFVLTNILTIHSHATRFNNTLNAGRVKWHDDYGPYELKFSFSEHRAHQQ